MAALLSGDYLYLNNAGFDGKIRKLAYAPRKGWQTCRLDGLRAGARGVAELRFSAPELNGPLLIAKMEVVAPGGRCLLASKKYWD